MMPDTPPRSPTRTNVVQVPLTAVVARRLAAFGTVAGLALSSTAALADCTADASGVIVNCTGTSTGYSNLRSGITFSADSTTALTGQVLLGSNAGVTNAGSLTSSTTAPVLQVGSASSVTNNGTISLTAGSTGSSAVLLGDNGTLTNNGNLSAPAGTAVAQFGQVGTFNNSSSALSAVTGNVIYGPNVSGGTSSLNNYNTTFGITGNIYSTGNTAIYNNGLLTGAFVQTPTGGTVSFTNDTSGVFTGSLVTGDTTALTNSGSMSITVSSVLGSAKLGVSSLVNSGTLNVGSSGSAQLTVNGGFVNTGVLNISLHSNGASAPVAGSSYSQIYAAGPSGTAALGGTLNLVPAVGFYPSGSTYNIIVADQSITGNFTTFNGNNLPFISFVPLGVVTIGTQQVYEVQAVRSSTYAQAISAVATPAQLAIAGGLEPLVTTANGDPTTAAAALVGQLDVLTIPQFQTLLDQVNPAGYLAYSRALVDQMNVFNRQVRLHAQDPFYQGYHNGWWGALSGQVQIGKSGPTDDRQSIYGGVAGFDFTGPHWRAGIAGGYSTARLRNGTATLNGSTNAYTLGGYGAFEAGPIVATGQVDYELGNISTTKTLSLSYTTTTTAATATTAAATTVTANNTSVIADPGQHLFRASGTVGVKLEAGGFKMTPFGGLEMSRGAINGFTETGGNAADLTVSRLGIKRTDVLAGVDLTLSEVNDPGEDLRLRPYLRAIYRSQLGSGNGSSVTAFFNGDPTSSFTVDGTANAKHEADIDAGLSFDYYNGSLFIGYQGTIRKGASQHGLNVGLHLPF